MMDNMDGIIMAHQGKDLYWSRAIEYNIIYGYGLDAAAGNQFTLNTIIYIQGEIIIK